MSRIGPTRGRSISPARIWLRWSGLGSASVEVLVLVGGDLARGRRRTGGAAARPSARPGWPGRRRARRRRPPVDHHRVAGLVGHVPAADVPALAGRVPSPRCRSGRRTGWSSGRRPATARAVVEGRCQELAGHPVAALGLQRQGALAHPGQLGAGPGQVAALRLERVEICGGHEGRPYAGTWSAHRVIAPGVGRRHVGPPGDPVNRSSTRALVASPVPPSCRSASWPKLPLAMGQLGMLLLVADRTGSYASGGLAAAAIGFGSAVGAPGRAAPRPTGSASASCCWWSPSVYAAGMLGVLALARRDAPRPGRLVGGRRAGRAVRAAGRPARPGALGGAGAPGRQARGERQRITEAFAARGRHRRGELRGRSGAGRGAGQRWPGRSSVPVVIAVLSLTAVVAFALHPTARVVRPSHTPHLTAARRGGLPGGATTALLLVVGCAARAGLRRHPGRRHQPDRRARSRGRGWPGLRAARRSAAPWPGWPVRGCRSGSRCRTGWSRSPRAWRVLSLPLLLVVDVDRCRWRVMLFGCAVAPYLIVLYALAERATPIERAATVMTMLSSAVIVGYAGGHGGGRAPRRRPRPPGGFRRPGGRGRCCVAAGRCSAVPG